MKPGAAIHASPSRRWLALILMVAGRLLAGTPYEAPNAYTAQNKIDEIVFAQLQQLQIVPAQLCSDAVFVRRVYLDVTGTLPSAR